MPNVIFLAFCFLIMVFGVLVVIVYLKKSSKDDEETTFSVNIFNKIKIEFKNKRFKK